MIQWFTKSLAIGMYRGQVKIETKNWVGVCVEELMRPILLTMSPFSSMGLRFLYYEPRNGATMLVS